MRKFYTRPEPIAQRARWKLAGKTVVFTSGCYDLPDPGPVRWLEKARSLGDIPILALNSDASVARLKGPTRPLIPEMQRGELAAALEAVDAVTLFDEDMPRDFAGREAAEAAGGKVLALSLEPLART